MKANVTLIEIAEATVLIALLFVLFSHQANLLKFGKSLGRAANLEVPCEETGVRLSEYKELIRQAVLTCNSKELLKQVSDAQYCFPDANINVPKDKEANTFLLQPGDNAVVCIHKKFLTDFQNQIRHCYNQRVPDTVTNSGVEIAKRQVLIVLGQNDELSEQIRNRVRALVLQEKYSEALNIIPTQVYAATTLISSPDGVYKIYSDHNSELREALKELIYISKEEDVISEVNYALERKSNLDYFDEIAVYTCIEKVLIEKQYLLKTVNPEKCRNKAFLGSFDSEKVDCLDKKFATEYGKTKQEQTILYLPQGTCPKTHTEFGSRKIVANGRVSTSFNDILSRAEEGLITIEDLAVQPKQVVYSTEQPKTAAVPNPPKTATVTLLVQNNAQFARRMALYIATGDKDVIPFIIRGIQDVPDMAGRGILTLGPGETKEIQASVLFTSEPKKFTLYLHADIFGTHVPLATIPVPVPLTSKVITLSPLPHNPVKCPSGVRPRTISI